MIRSQTVLVAVLYLAFIAFSVKVKRDVARAEAFAEFDVRLSPGETAPAFELSDFDGSVRSLERATDEADLVLLNFWATWCGPCRLEMPMLQSIHERYRDDGLLVIGINVGEDEDTVAAFATERGVSFPIVLDGDGSVSTRYRVDAFPTTFLIAGGTVVRVSEGLDPYLRHRVEDLLLSDEKESEAF